MPHHSKPVIECVDVMKMKKVKLLEIRDIIFLIGFGNPFLSEKQIVLNAGFKKYKSEASFLNDAMIDLLNERRKVNPNTVSLSFEWLRHGQNFSRQLWRCAYQKMIDKGYHKKQALVTLTGLLKEIKADHHTATLFTKSDAGISFGLGAVCLPLISGENNRSVSVSKKMTEALKEVQLQFAGLSKNANPELVFEKSTKPVRAFTNKNLA